MSIGIGTFVRNDIDGNPIYVGDKVIVHRPAFHIDAEDSLIEFDSESWTGRVAIILSKGLVIRTKSGYIKPPISDNSRLKWTWKKIN